MLRDQVVLVMLSFGVNALAFLFQFLMARVMTPTAWKDTMAILALLTIISVPSIAINTLAIKMSGELHIRNQFEDLWRWVTRTISLVLAAGAAVAGAFVLLSGWIKEQLQLEASTGVLVAGLASALLLGSTVVRGALAGVRSFVTLGLVSMTETLTRVIVAVALVTAGFAAAGAVGGSAAGALLFIALGLFFLRKRRNAAPEQASSDAKFPRWTEQARVLTISFGLAVLFNIDSLIVARFFSTEEAASYLAMGLIGRTIFFMSGPVSIVLLPHVIRVYANGESVVPSLALALALITFIVTTTAVSILVFPTHIFSLVFREGYTLDLPILSIYTVIGSLFAVNAALANVLIGVGYLRAWIGMLAVALGLMVSLFILHDSLTQIALVLATAVSISAIYLSAETAIFLRRNNTKSPAQGRS
jgi:O-antigen/teichoic acid export membrane protein